MSDKQVTLTIDGQEITVPEGLLIIRAAERIGTFIPRFCDHPLLDPLGACRQCLVEVEGQRKPLTACTTPVSDGMVVKTQETSELARDGQEGVLELLLINHPLDCPMCDKGGECPLQDQTLVYGPGVSRYIDAKRRFVKPIPISPQIKLDRERCVLCARCTRFAGEISGDPFIELFERSALEQVAISPDEPYESIFSGNVVQICPVGALTSTSYRFKARPFDVVGTPSTCNRCASGCSIEVQSRRGQLVRVYANENLEVNDTWMCDKGRWAFDYVASPERVTEPMVHKEGEFVAVSWAEALRVVGERLAKARDGAGIGVLGGAQLLDEDAYALSRFARTVLGTNDVDARLLSGTDDEEEMFAALPASATATNADIDRATVIVVAGMDLQQESPIVFLRLRKAARRGATIVEIGPRRSALAGVGARWLACPPGGETGALVALARALEEAGGSGLDPWSRAAVVDAAPVAASANVDRPEAEHIARALADARGAVVLLGGDALAGAPGAIPLAWNLAIGLEGAFGWVPRKAGAFGAAWAGLHPALLPGGRRVVDDADRGAVDAVWGATVPAGSGRDARAILSDAGSLGALYLVGVDPVRDGADRAAAARGLEAAPFVVAHDVFLTESSRRADVVLPAAAAYERDGSLSNWEGRSQPVRAAVPPAGLAQSDHEVLAQVATVMGTSGFPASLEAVRAEMDRLRPERSEARALPVPELRPRADGAGELVLVPVRMLIDAGTMLTGADQLRATGEGSFVELHPEDAAARGIGDGAPVTLQTERGSRNGTALLTDRIIRGAVGVPVQTDEGGVNELADLDAGLAVVSVEAG